MGGASTGTSDRPIFVVGCPRSGTTMLQLMLHAHPRIALPPENRFVLPAYKRRAEFGDLNDPRKRRELAEWIVNYKSFDDLGLDREQTVEAIVAAPPTLGSALGTVFKLYSDRFGKPRWGDKRPAYLKHLPTLLRLFPDAQIVNIMRDGRDCVASLKEAPWRPRGFEEFTDFWVESAEASRAAARRYRADTYHMVRYEDLVSDPETHLRELCRFLGEDYDPQMAKPSELASVAVPEYKTWHALTHEEVTTERVASWRKRLTDDELRRCEAAFGERLRWFGYEPVTDAGARATTSARTAARRRLGAAKRAAKGVVTRLARREPPVAARLTSGQR